MLLILFCLALLLSLCLGSLSVAADTISVAYNPGVAPLEFEDSEGRAAGLIPDIWHFWAKKTGNEVRLIKADSFESSLEAVKNGSAKLHAGLFKTVERESFLAYSKPVLNLNYYLFTHPSINSIRSIEETSGLIVGIQKGEFTEKWVRERVPENQIKIYDTFTEIFQAALKGEVKVFVATRINLFYYLDQNRLSNIFSYNEKKPLYSRTYYSAALKKNQALIDEVNNGLDAIKPVEREQLERKWLTIGEAPTPPSVFWDMLTPDEKAFYVKNQHIRVHNERAWPPFNYNEYGIPKGFSIDYINLLAEKTGFLVQFISYPVWQQFLSMMKFGKLDVMLNIAKTSNREAYLSFTSPYAKSDQILYMREGNERIYAMEDLFDKTMAVPRGFNIEEVLKKYPRIRILAVDDMSQAILAVSKGDADALSGPGLVMHNLIRELGVTNLIPMQEIIPNGNMMPLCMAVPKDRAILAAILEKGMSLITETEIRLLEKRWLETEQNLQGQLTSLTALEKAWIKEHPVLKLGADPLFAPFEFFSKTGIYSGMAADYMAILEQRLGIHLEPIKGLTWKETTTNAKDQAIDVLPCVGITKERKQYLIYTEPYLKFIRVIVTRRDSTAINRLEDLETVPFGVQSNSSHHGFIKENTAYTPLLFNTFEEAMLSLSRHEIEAVVANLAAASYVIQRSGLTNLKIAGQASNTIKPLAMAVRKDWPELVPILNKALESITPEEHLAIRKRWIVLEPPNTEKQNEKTPIKPIMITMTPMERSFIATHKPIPFSEVNWAPLSIIKDVRTADTFGNADIVEHKEFNGIIADYLDMITQRSGLYFSFQKSDNWFDVLQKYVDKEILMIPAIGVDNEIGRKILLSDSFVSFPLVRVTRNDVSYIGDTSDLNKKKVAVGRGYTSFHYLKKNYGQIDIVEVDDVRKGLLKVSNGQVFAFVGHMAVVIDNLQKLGLKNLKINGETAYVFDHRIGIDPQYPEAVSIINKSLASITDEEHRSIYSKWLTVEYKKGVDYRLVWKIAIIGGLFLALFLFWNRKMAREIASRRKIEEQFQAMAANVPGAIFQATISPEAVFEFLYVSQGMESHFGISPQDLINRTRNLEMTGKDQENFEQRLRNAAKREGKFEFSGQMATLNDKQQWVQLVAKPDLHNDKTIIYNGLMLNITGRKLAEQERLASERKLWAMSQAMEDALVMINGQGKVLFWNYAAEGLFGYSTKEAMGNDFHAMAVPPEVQEQAKQGLIKFAKTGQGEVFGSTIQTTAINRAGDFFPVEISLSSFHVDNQWFAVGTIRDITERKKSEDELKDHMEDLKRFNRLAISREERMIELKKEINQLLKQQGQEIKYKIR